MSRTDLKKRLAGLSPEQRERLFAKLEGEKKDRPAKAREAAIPVQPRGAEDYALSFAQQRLWFLYEYEPDSAEYNIPQGFRLRGDLDLDALRQGLGALVERHEVLRTRFHQVETEPRQVIDPPRNWTADDLPLVDVAGEGDPWAEALRLASEDAQEPFDLTARSLLRARLYRLAADDHLLYLNVHHIVYDGWSQGVFLAELGELYAAAAEEREPALPPLPVQYLDFGLWQRDHLQGEVLAEHVDAWRERLAGIPALELPTDRPRPATKTHDGEAHPFELDAGLSRKLRALASASEATPFITVLAAYRALLARYAGQGDIGIGTLIANRRRREAEGLIGFFANTLVLRTNASDNPTFRELTARERETALEAYARQDLPFEKLVEELSPPRDLSRTPLFQTMFILQNAPSGSSEGGEKALKLPGVEISPVGVDSRTSKFDLSLYMTDVADRDAPLTGFFEYNVDLFDRSTIERMTEHFRRLLESAVADPDRKISELPLLAEDERTTLVEEWNATSRELPDDATVHGLFFERAEKTPDAEAVVCDGERLTYAELADRTRTLAAHLETLGVGPETLVGVFLERSVDMLVAVLGVLEAGAAYVPLDPEYPEDRIAYMVESSGLPVVVTQQELEEKLPEAAKARRIVRIDADWKEIEASVTGAGGAERSSRGLPESLAYVIYTSGSTGKPKGVQIEHRSVVNFLRSMAREPGFSPEDALLAVTTLSFDIAGLELYLPLIVGGRVVIATRETAQAGELLLETVADAGATVMQATPATWRLLLDAGWSGPPPAKILCGGEALPRDLADRLLGALEKDSGSPGGELWNMYGPTEATIWSSVLAVQPGLEAVPVGPPIDNTALYVLDPALRPVPVGVPGELFIGGDGLARGYLGRPGLTADRFLPDPFVGAPVVRQGARMYRTGDLVRWRPDGTIAFMGRIDHQVKVRGYRIELGEIEAVLGSHSGVDQAVVIVREDRPGDKRLAAYLVAVDPEEAPTVGELRAHLKERLPDYMVPPIFIVLDDMPLTPNGKVDRRSLPAPDRNRPELGEEYLAPRNPTEAALAAMWSEILGLERVGVNDDFFDLGGDSLMVIKVVSQANKAGLGVTTKQVFQNRTIAELAAVAGTSEILAEQGLVTGDTPFTPAQLHFLELGHPNPGWHSLGTLLELETAVDVDAVEEAMRLLLVQHDNLRVRMMVENGTRRLVTDGEPAKEGGVELHRLDFSGLDEAGWQGKLRDTVFELTKSFDLENGPLFKGAYMDLGPGREKLVFLIAHFFSADVGSWHTILDDFDTYYRALAAGEEPVRQAKTTSAQQWAQRLAERAAAEEIRAEVPFWLGESRLRATRLPKDMPEGANLFKSAKNIQSRFTVEETRALLLEIPRKFKVQIDGLLLTAMLYGFQGWTGGETYLVDLLGHGREALYDDTDLTRTVGWLNTIFPVALSLEDTKSLEEGLVAVNRQLREIPHGGIGYGILRYLSNDEEVARKMREMPEPDVFFNYFGPDNEEQLHTFRKADGWGGYVLDNTTRRLRPMAVGVFIKHDRMLIKWEYSSQVHEEATVRRVVDRAEEVLRHFMAAVGCESRPGSRQEEEGAEVAPAKT